jgi:hypothetical protein
MSWLFSRALVEASSGATSWGGELCAPSNGSPTPQAYLSPDRMTAFSRPSRFGMTFAPLTADRGADVLTWFLAGFPVRTSALQARAQASTASDPACGHTWRELWATFDPASSSWRTLQPSLLADSAELSPTWPRSGMTAAGRCWALPMLGRRTSATDSGLWVPTPIRNDAEKRGDFDPMRSWGLAGFAKLFPTPTASGFDVQDVPLLLARREACKEKNKNGNGFGLTLNQWVKVQNWPTPTSSLGTKGGRVTPRKSREGGTLIEAVSARAWPTPTRHDGTQVDTDSHRDGRRNQPCLGSLVNQEAGTRGGQLNPTWVEWLMGWPLGWTDLKPLATAKCQSAPPQLGAFSQVEVAA